MPISVIKHVDLLRAAGAIRDKLFSGPANIYLDIEQKCNLSCIYCRIHSFLLPRRIRAQNRLSARDIRRVMRAAKKWRSGEIIFTGHGEPTLNPDFVTYLKLALESGIPVSLYTNATFPHAYLNILKEPSNITINFSAPTLESFVDSVCEGNPGLFSRIVRNIQLLARLRKGKTTEISFVITRHNHYLFNNILRFAARCGIKRVVFSHMMPTAATAKIALRAEDTPALKKSIAGCLPCGVEHNLAEIARLSALPGYARITKCLTGWYNLVFSANGDATICCRHEIPVIGSLKTDDPEIIWAGSKAQKARIGYKYRLDMKKQPFKDTCGCCRWVGFFASRITGFEGMLEKAKNAAHDTRSQS